MRDMLCMIFDTWQVTAALYATGAHVEWWDWPEAGSPAWAKAHFPGDTYHLCYDGASGFLPVLAAWFAKHTEGKQILLVVDSSLTAHDYKMLGEADDVVKKQEAAVGGA